MKRIIVSGIQPTGELHIGNYLGAVKTWLELQKDPDNECFYFIADLHSMTIEYDPAKKHDQIFSLAAELLALGIDPKRAHLFVQSEIPEHAELAWIFMTLTPLAELNKMTQFKDKSSRNGKNVNAGLFTYPVLQAADILMYNATAIPVGEDQIQHIEFTRVIAKKFNSAFGKFFVEPKPILTQTPRVMSLSEPDKKMSKSHGEKSYIKLSDSPETIQTKLRKAVADEHGVKNLLRLLKLFDMHNCHNQFVADYKNGTLKNIELKDMLAQHIAQAFSDYRIRRDKISEKEIHTALERGRSSSAKIAVQTMKIVRKKIGLR